MGNESPRQDKRRLLNSLAQPKPVRPPKPLGAPHVIERVSNGIRILGTDPAKAKHPAVNPWVPEEFAGPIGKVVLTLNWLEQDLVALLRSIEAYNGTTLGEVPMALGKRVARFKVALGGAPFSHAASLAAYFLSLMKRIEADEWKRNF